MVLRFTFILLLTTATAAGPAFERDYAQQQQILKSESLIMPSKQQRLHSSPYLDAKPTSIGILFTTPGGEEEEVMHLWLPIGERIYTRRYSQPEHIYLHSLTQLRR
jgi:hypothetical protein